MSALRILRNVAVLAILAVGGLSLGPRPVSGQNSTCSGGPQCGPRNGHCCSYHIGPCTITNCYDLDTRARCHLIAFCT
jgi:hypothetical protein